MRTESHDTFGHCLRRGWTALWFCAALSALVGCGAAPQRAPVSADEPDTQAYIQAQLARIAPARTLRLRLLATSAWRAEMHPDDRLDLSMGLLIRVADSAELVFLCAHELAHAELGHFARRDQPNWDDLAAELEADAYAARTLRRSHLRADAGHTLLAALIDEASLAPGAESSLHHARARLAALPSLRGTTRHQAVDAWPKLRAELLTRWLPQDPAHDDLARLAVLQRAH